MAKSFACGVSFMLGSLVMVPLAAVPVAAGQSRDAEAGPALVRVRSTMTRILTTIREGYARSPTFRRLVSRLEQEQVLLYVEPGRCRPMDTIRLAACLVFVERVGRVSHLRIVIDVGHPKDRLIALLGHELQHAVEMIDADIGRPDEVAATATRVRPGVYETDEAQRVSRTILAELRRK